MVHFEKLVIPAASLGPMNPMPDIKNVSYIHAGYEMTDKVAEEEKKYIGKGMIPTMLPYRLQDGYDREKKPRAFQAAVVENDHVRAVFLPELGGRLYSIYNKDERKELLYVNPVFQPGNLGLRNAWFSGGVEFNVGIKGHNPLTCSPVFAAVDQTPEGEVLRLYEFERIRGVAYSVSAWVREDSPTLYLRCRIENRTDETKYMYWWSNIAVPETPGTRVIVPAERSFLSFYNADHYILDKTAIPMADGVDVSYPAHIPSSRDFFYQIPKTSPRSRTSRPSGSHPPMKRAMACCNAPPAACLDGKCLYGAWGREEGTGTSGSARKAPPISKFRPGWLILSWNTSPWRAAPCGSGRRHTRC